MWKLTITQKRKSEYSDNMITEQTEFENDDINELVHIIEHLSCCDGNCETAYKLESKAK